MSNSWSLFSYACGNSYGFQSTTKHTGAFVIRTVVVFRLCLWHYIVSDLLHYCCFLSILWVDIWLLMSFYCIRADPSVQFPGSAVHIMGCSTNVVMALCCMHAGCYFIVLLTLLLRLYYLNIFPSRYNIDECVTPISLYIWTSLFFVQCWGSFNVNYTVKWRTFRCDDNIVLIKRVF